ncbi:MAG TPA: iron ABC transporter permease [Casimicrobiaceae bacterium]|nr:iron ABC transporter permease [Casimicrobiaceae bacterium]
MLRAPLTFFRTLATLAILSSIAAIAFFAALKSGSIDVSVAEVASALSGRAHDEHAAIVRDLRLPRALAAFAVGALLAIAGALMQVLLRNPLADPYVLGISGGAAVGALGALLVGATVATGPAAFGGALVSTLLVFSLARSDTERTPWAPTRLLLTGVVIAAGWGAMIALLLTLAPAAQVKGMVYWLLGDLSGATAPGLTFAALLLVLVAALALARDLNALVHGVDDATALGVDVPKLALMLYALTALATSAAVTTAGSVGFVGLVVPHAMRLWLGNDQRLLVPAAAIAGGSLLVVADTAARTIVAPLELPVGVLTAMIGVPAFLWLLSRGR